MKSLANIVFWFVLLFLIGSAYATEVAFQKHVIDGSLLQAYSVEAADIDSDGDIDVAVGWLNGITWFENDGAESFTRHEALVANQIGVKDIILIDFDDDMDVDILYNDWENKLIGWLDNDGNGYFTKREIFRNVIESYSIFSADLDGDGDLDVASANHGIGGRGNVTWYENNGIGVFSEHIIDNKIYGAVRVIAVDLDEDRNIDVVSSGMWDNTIAWYENDGNKGFLKHNITNNGYQPSSLISLDFDKGGDIDIVYGGFAGNRIGWYENDGNEVFSEHLITSTMMSPQSLFIQDFDNDEDWDVSSAFGLLWPTTDFKIAWYENDGSEVFSEHLITESIGAVKSVSGGDIDDDKDSDIVIVSFYGDVVWFENLLPRPPALDLEFEHYIDDGSTGDTFSAVGSSNTGVLVGYDVKEDELQLPAPSAGDYVWAYTDPNGVPSGEHVTRDSQPFNPDLADNTWLIKLAAHDDGLVGLSGTAHFNLKDPNALNDLPEHTLAVITRYAGGTAVESYNLSDVNSIEWPVTNVFGEHATMELKVIYDCLAVSKLAEDPNFVDFRDFAEFADSWEQAGPASSDIDGSNATDMSDLAIIADCWLTDCASL